MELVFFIVGAILGAVGTAWRVARKTGATMRAVILRGHPGEERNAEVQRGHPGEEQ